MTFVGFYSHMATPSSHKSGFMENHTVVGLKEGSKDVSFPLINPWSPCRHTCFMGIYPGPQAHLSLSFVCLQIFIWALTAGSSIWRQQPLNFPVYIYTWLLMTHCSGQNLEIYNMNIVLIFSCFHRKRKSWHFYSYKHENHHSF